jgi:hypothetical protein
MTKIIYKASAIVLFALGIVGVAGAQSFNIDLDVGGGDPGVGSGAPSSSFGGAAGQPGFWNRFGFGGVPLPVGGLDGIKTSIVMDASYHGAGGGGGGFAFTGNTGDYALLLNDAATVGSIGAGGRLTYTFTGLAAAAYLVFSYAANVNGIAIDTPVTIPGAIPTTEVVTGPMSGNALEHLVTHSIHAVQVNATGTFEIIFQQPPMMHANMDVNGFQVVMVPEVGTAPILTLPTVQNVHWFQADFAK